MTKSPISTISYNTVEFLRDKLQGYIDAHIIQGYMFIKHKGEDGDKDHIHVIVIPNKKIDPMFLRADLKELVKGEEKPRGTMMWYVTHEKNIYDWVLYVVHDKEYLDKKYQNYEQHEKLPYSWKEIESDGGIDVELYYLRGKAALKHTSSNITERILNGAKPTQLLLEGESPSTINFITHAVHNNEFSNLKNDYDTLYQENLNIKRALENANLKIEIDERGVYFIVER